MKFLTFCAFSLLSLNLISSADVNDELVKSIEENSKNGKVNDIGDLGGQTNRLVCASILGTLNLYANQFKASDSVKNCLTKISDDGEACKNVFQCNKEAVEKWKSAQDPKNAKALCCRSWDYFDCFFKYNKEKCDSDQFNELRKFWDDNREEISKAHCPDYAYGSHQCKYSDVYGSGQRKSSGHIIISSMFTLFTSFISFYLLV